MQLRSCMKIFDIQHVACRHAKTYFFKSLEKTTLPTCRFLSANVAWRNLVHFWVLKELRLWGIWKILPPRNHLKSGSAGNSHSGNRQPDMQYHISFIDRSLVQRNEYSSVIHDIFIALFLTINGQSWDLSRSTRLSCSLDLEESSEESLEAVTW